jgi:hypothetical protein
MPQQYINSGILEAYVTGSASEQEVQELMRMKSKYPKIDTALQELEVDMEKIAQHMAVRPPSRTWDKISDQIDELILRPEFDPEKFEERNDNRYQDYNNANRNTGPQYIEVESESSHMKIHKAWKWVFAAVFVLGKIFLGCAIYFYLENRQAKEQLQELKTELKQLRK